MALTGNLNFENFQNAILNEDIDLISSTPGIGKKTAQRLIIEMRDKLNMMGKNIISSNKSSHISDAVNALVKLGYNYMQAQKAIKKAKEEIGETKDVGKLVSIGLKKIMNIF